MENLMELGKSNADDLVVVHCAVEWPEAIPRRRRETPLSASVPRVSTSSNAVMTTCTPVHHRQMYPMISTSAVMSHRTKILPATVSVERASANIAQRGLKHIPIGVYTEFDDSAAIGSRRY